MYANHTVPYRKLYLYVECLRIILKWPSTVPYHDARVSYRTAPYRTEIKTDTLSSRVSWRNNYLPRATVRYRTIPYGTAGGMGGSLYDNKC